VGSPSLQLPSEREGTVVWASGAEAAQENIMEEAIYSNWRSLQRPDRIVRSNKSDNMYGKYTIRPLERGFGTTLGNALRRTMLSSLQGTAITHIKIDGVTKDVSYLPGIIESVTDLELNLKGLRLKMTTGQTGSASLHVSAPAGGGTVIATGGDLTTDGSFEILNPDHSIATVSAGASLKIDIVARLGRGYDSATDVGDGPDKKFVAIDAAYSPIERVRYAVTNARVGKRTDYDKLVMEIWTDGSVVPEDALGYAAQLLREQTQVFINFDEADEPEPEVIVDETPEWPPVLYQRVDSLELTVRSQNCLQNAGVEYVYQLVQKTEGEMLKTRNFGRKSLNELKEILTELELSFGMRLEGFKADG
jgi:DNA-directed RNA polymerase subunit alpha